MSTTGRIPLALLILVPSAAALATAPTAYEVDPAHSTVRIALLDSQQSFEASISNLAGNVRLSGDQLTPSSLDLVFDLAALDSGTSSLDELLRGRRYFWVDRHPYGLTFATDVRATGLETFQADTTLALRDMSCKEPVTFNWRVAIEGGQSVGYFHGTTRVDARDFRIQSADAWHQVMTITYDLLLTPVPGKVRPVTRWRPDTEWDTDAWPPPRCSFASWSAGAFSPEAVRVR